MGGGEGDRSLWPIGNASILVASDSRLASLALHSLNVFWRFWRCWDWEEDRLLGRPGRRSRTECVGWGAGVGSLPLAHRDLRLGGSGLLVVFVLVLVAHRLFLFRGTELDSTAAVDLVALSLDLLVIALVLVAPALVRLESKCPSMDFK